MEKQLVYGVSSKEIFGEWDHKVYRFDDHETADRWIATEEYDFIERELMSEILAIRLCGVDAVENAEFIKEL